jgi:pyrimidine-nucleoside phosphorylase
MVSIGKSVNRNTVAVISDMDQPLGFAVGNALEVKEAIDTLNGVGPRDLLELCLTLGSNMVVLAKKAETVEEARNMLLKVIEDKSALKKLKEFVVSQGGNPNQVDNTELLPKAKYVAEVKSEVEGYISRIDSQHIGLIAMELGAGRATKEDNVDLAVGVVLNKKRGDKVSNGETLAYIHANDEGKIEKATKNIIESYHITKESPKDIPLIYGVIK